MELEFCSVEADKAPDNIHESKAAMTVAKDRGGCWNGAIT
jgi:hypothetical protein